MEKQNKLSDCIRKLAEETSNKLDKDSMSRMDKFKKHIKCVLELMSVQYGYTSYSIPYNSTLMAEQKKAAYPNEYYKPNETEFKKLMSWLEDEGFEVERQVSAIKVSW